MDKATSTLKQWAINFLKNKDLIIKQIDEIEEMKGQPEFKINFKTKQIHYLIFPILTGENLENLENENSLGIFTMHMKENFDILIGKWNEISQLRLLTIYFINPYITTENKWIIHPYTHSMIADNSVLKSGLKTMFSQIEPVRQQDLKRNIHF